MDHNDWYTKVDVNRVKRDNGSLNHIDLNTGTEFIRLAPNPTNEKLTDVITGLLWEIDRLTEVKRVNKELEGVDHAKAN